MAKIFFTSDWHLSSSGVIHIAKRPFASAEKMNEALIRVCNQQTKGEVKEVPLLDKYGKEVHDSHGDVMTTKVVTEKDTVIHIGDFCEYGNDNHYNNDKCKTGLKINPSKFISQINANFINMLGNHDKSNKVKSAGYTMITSLYKFNDVSISHYPSWYEEAYGTFISHRYSKYWTIRLCGHVHNEWKYRFDTINRILNINMGVDVWNYNIVSETKLIGFIGSIENEINRIAYKK